MKIKALNYLSAFLYIFLKNHICNSKIKGGKNMKEEREKTLNHDLVIDN